MRTLSALTAQLAETKKELEARNVPVWTYRAVRVTFTPVILLFTALKYIWFGIDKALSALGTFLQPVAPYVEPLYVYLCPVLLAIANVFAMVATAVPACFRLLGSAFGSMGRCAGLGLAYLSASIGRRSQAAADKAAERLLTEVAREGVRESVRP